jgi:hypothetical protein
MNDRELIEKLHQLIIDLLWISESDYPWEIFFEENSEQISILSIDSLVEILTVEDFFTPAIAEYDWQNEEERTMVKKYQNLLSFLQENLTDLKVYRWGEVEISIYIIGKTIANNFLGLVTKAIET